MKTLHLWSNVNLFDHRYTTRLCFVHLHPPKPALLIN